MVGAIVLINSTVIVPSLRRSLFLLASGLMLFTFFNTTYTYLRLHDAYHTGSWFASPTSSWSASGQPCAQSCGQGGHIALRAPRMCQNIPLGTVRAALEWGSSGRRMPNCSKVSPHAKLSVHDGFAL